MRQAATGIRPGRMQGRTAGRRMGQPTAPLPACRTIPQTVGARALVFRTVVRIAGRAALEVPAPARREAALDFQTATQEYRLLAAWASLRRARMARARAAARTAAASVAAHRSWAWEFL